VCNWEDAANNNNKNCDNFLLKKKLVLQMKNKQKILPDK